MCTSSLAGTQQLYNSQPHEGGEARAVWPSQQGQRTGAQSKTHADCRPSGRSSLSWSSLRTGGLSGPFRRARTLQQAGSDRAAWKLEPPLCTAGPSFCGSTRTALGTHRGVVGRTLVPAGLQHVDVAEALVLAAEHGRLGAGRRKVRAAPAAHVRAGAAVHTDLALHAVDSAAYRRVDARQVEPRQRGASLHDALALGAAAALGALAARQRAQLDSQRGAPACMEQALNREWGAGPTKLPTVRGA